MGTPDYEALIAERQKSGGNGDAVARARAERLAEMARNLRTLRERAEEEAAREGAIVPAPK